MGLIENGGLSTEWPRVGDSCWPCKAAPVAVPGGAGAMNPLAGYRPLALHSAPSPGHALPPADGGSAIRSPAMTLQAVGLQSQDAMTAAGGLGGNLMMPGGASGVQHVLKPSAAGIAKKRAPTPLAAGERRKQRNVLCTHNRRKQNCLECGTAVLCPHNKRKAFCRSPCAISVCAPRHAFSRCWRTRGVKRRLL